MRPAAVAHHQLDVEDCGTSIDVESGARAGNWKVNGGSGDYSRLKGTGTFTETQNLNYLGVGTDSITLLGTMHTD